MARDSGQKFIRRNRPPRVHITYENPANAEEKVEIPFVMGVMSDLSGNTPGVEKEEIAQRKFLDFDMDIQRKEDPKGDRVKVTLNGKFLPYKTY